MQAAFWGPPVFLQQWPLGQMVEQQAKCWSANRVTFIESGRLAIRIFSGRSSLRQVESNPKVEATRLSVDPRVIQVKLFVEIQLD